MKAGYLARSFGTTYIDHIRKKMPGTCDGWENQSGKGIKCPQPNNDSFNMLWIGNVFNKVEENRLEYLQRGRRTRQCLYCF